jgi:hypothetical protein
MNESTEIIQYQELCKSARSYEIKLWCVPATAIVISILFFIAIFSIGSLMCQIGLSVLNALSFAAFLVMFTKDRCYLIHLQKTIRMIHDKDQRFIKLAQFSGPLEIDNDDIFYIRFAKRHSATNFMFWALFVFLIINITCSIYHIWLLLSL